MNNQMIAVWGNPNSGKTTLSYRIAQKITENKNENCILVHCQKEGSPLATFFPQLEESGSSLGKLISTPDFSQEDILKSLVNLSEYKNFAMLGYRSNENHYTNPKEIAEQVVDLFVLLKQMAHTIIVDCNSLFIEDLVTEYALKNADHVIRVGSGDTKSLTYFGSVLPMLSDIQYGVEKQIKILNDVTQFEGIEAVAEQYLGVDYFMDYNFELKLLNEEGKMLQPLSSSRKNIQWNETLNLLCNHLMGLEDDKKIPKKRKKSRIGRKEDHASE